MLKKKPATGRIFLLLLAGCFFVSCADDTTGPEKPTLPPVYFEVNTFLQEQIQLLEQANPTVQKTVTNGSLPSQTESLTNVNWQQELAFFLEADINKPAWRQTFSADTLLHTTTGARTYVYQNQSDDDTPVKLVEVETTANQQVKSIRIETRQHNALFFAGRSLYLSADTTATRNRLSGYTVKGIQKPVFADSLRYSVQARLVYKPLKN